MKLLLTDTETFFNSLKQSSAGLNPSLLLYKYSEPDLKDKKGDFLKLVCEHHNKNTVLMAEKVQQNIDAVFKTIPSERKKFFTLTTISNLAVNLSQNCIVENSAVSFYQPYGFAYLPASGIKGMARAYAVNKGYNDAFIKQIFGDDDKDGSKFAGSITFYDAIPLKADLHTDISNCHHTEYYKGKVNPIDNEGALPSLFLALKSGSEFNFAISLRSGLKDESKNFILLAQTEQILKEALFTNGIGAKTSLGYGIFDDKNSQTQQEIINLLSAQLNPDKKSEKQTLLTNITLESPAFLAGSDLTVFEKPALRSATLRGLLRWWWRRIYFNNPQAIEELTKKNRHRQN
jgi:CRISPR-associated protein Cmr6